MSWLNKIFGHKQDKEKVKVLVMNNPLSKRLFFSQGGAYRNIPNLTWLLGCALGKYWETFTDIDIMIFQESIDWYRNQGIDATIDKILLHELQHIAMFRKGLPSKEPLISMVQEYGIIEGKEAPMQYYYVKPHWMLPNIHADEFYNHAKVEDYEVEWVNNE